MRLKIVKSKYNMILDTHGVLVSKSHIYANPIMSWQLIISCYEGFSGACHWEIMEESGIAHRKTRCICVQCQHIISAVIVWGNSARVWQHLLKKIRRKRLCYAVNQNNQLMVKLKIDCASNYYLQEFVIAYRIW